MKVLQRQVKALRADLLVQSRAVPELADWLLSQYKAAYAGKRTGATFESWRDEQLDQAAVAWVLGMVFVRFCEDNSLVDQVWIGGPETVDAAVQARTAYFMGQPTHNDRHWILEAFAHLLGFRATSALFDEHNPVWRFHVSADAAEKLLEFWQRNEGLASFASLDTRFLGDLYQDLSEDARKRYALLQTPEFVEEFILDLTLTPSLQEYGLAETSVIDPTCGSGHFLLGAFYRLHKRWLREAPAMDPRERVQKALDQVTGVDINPIAVAIARFRLLIAAMQACGETRLASAPGFRIRLAAGDSLLKWGGGQSSHQGDMLSMLQTGKSFAYFTEDGELLADYLRPGQYTVAVGNPPYIAVKDKVLNEEYRKEYKDVCSGKYALSVPFVQRFFQLVRIREESGRAGFVGQITANSFMKREFGKKLIEQYLAMHVELSHVIDTSGAYIPGHGTPTVILAGRRRYPKALTVRAVLGILGEPPGLEDAAEGLVWRAIVDNVDQPGAPNPYVTVSEAPRETLARHPWSLSGGGAGGLKEAIESRAAQRIGERAARIGIFGMTNADDVVFTPRQVVERCGLESIAFRRLVVGDEIRDYQLADGEYAFFPYATDFALQPLDSFPCAAKRLWPTRTVLGNRATFAKLTYFQEGRPWYEWHQVTVDRGVSPLTITYAFVATHNHFMLDRGGKVFNRSAPVIKLPAGASEDDHLVLLGLLNSSTACFWLQQVSHNKGGPGGGYSKDEKWHDFYEFTGTKLQDFPLPKDLPLSRARRLDRLAQELAAVRPSAISAAGVPTRDSLNKAHAEYEIIRGDMIAVQEELDWEVYRLYGLIDENQTAAETSVPRLNNGERAFEIALARKVADGQLRTSWFDYNDFKFEPVTEIPAHWPEAYKAVVERRIQIIEERPDMALIERPECKRRWALKSWEKQEREALRDWLLYRLEAESLWREAGRARVLSVAQLADRVLTDADFRSVVALYCGRDDYDLAAELTKLVVDEVVPYMAMYRYKASGLAKRAQWERTWELQRREDAGETLDKPIPVPPKYISADFAKISYWRNRGKLDVSKERFVAYPKAGRDADKTPVIGWAGWDHVDQAQALATLYLERKTQDAWPVERLLPLLAGLVELEPWLRQWYADPAPSYPMGVAAFYTTLIDSELAALGRGRADLAPEKLS
ncbi:BREX-2 system adenine-specific DNA-methyltransferase PglX [Micromonospora sp. NPDC005206]|uniref:BREX-2 system adenine-specific DNA-methyltransferase PglX n=1 Tax=Micromonospora sp. NPDC005206 TaxID=3157022 RepID=UPI0033AD3FF1